MNHPILQLRGSDLESLRDESFAERKTQYLTEILLLARDYAQKGYEHITLTMDIPHDLRYDIIEELRSNYHIYAEFQVNDMFLYLELSDYSDESSPYVVNHSNSHSDDYTFLSVLYHISIIMILFFWVLSIIQYNTSQYDFNSGFSLDYQTTEYNQIRDFWN